MKIIYLILFLLMCSNANAQLQGIVFGQKNGKKTPLKGARVTLLNDKTTVLSEENGRFELILPKILPDTLVISCKTYINDTIVVTTDDRFAGLEIVLFHENELEEVVLEFKRDSKNYARLKPLLVEQLGEGELKKAACCNLSESFETNATVDVNVTDAVSGARKIQLLGLDGVYTQFQMENVPFLNGSESSFGLNTIPGTWVESIQITKGTGSVANGYESMAGLINVEFKKPRKMPHLAVNAYGSVIGRGEFNLHGSQIINQKWSTATFAHGSSVMTEIDRNKDGFRDVPLSKTASFLHRWEYQGEKFEARFGFNVSYDERKGGQLSRIDSAYKMLNRYNHYDVFAKTGWLFPNKPHHSFGVVYRLKKQDMRGNYGLRELYSDEVSGNVNAIYDGQIKSAAHKYKVGGTFFYQNVTQRSGFTDHREFSVPGAFAEYTYTGVRLIAVLGARYDLPAGYKQQFSPRVHLKYILDEQTDLRITAGKAWRLPLVLSDNYFLLATSKAWSVPAKMEQEEAWNFGASIVRSGKLWDRAASISLDAYHTRFLNQLVVDRDRSLDTFYLEFQHKTSYSTVGQVELSIMPMKVLTLRFAYKYLDVRANFGGTMRQQVMVPKNRFLVNAAFESRNKKWAWDATFSLYGKMRLHDVMEPNGEHEQAQYSSVVPGLMSQVTYRMRKMGMEVYLGGENLLNYTQPNPIIGVNDPFGSTFDATRVWAPILGTVVYAGFRMEIKRKEKNDE